MNRAVDRKAREIALWIIYGIDVSDDDAAEALMRARPTVSEIEPELTDVWDEVRRRVVGVASEMDSLNEKIQAVSPRWRISRMALIDRNILRLGAWEILFGDIPPLLVINACVDLAKEYGEKTTPGFVNGLLDQICTEHDISIT